MAWDQSLIEWSFGGPLSELYQMTHLPTKMATISQHGFNIRPYGQKYLKIFSFEIAWPVGTKLCWNGPLDDPFLNGVRFEQYRGFQ